MNKSFSVDVICPIPPNRIEKVWFITDMPFSSKPKYICNGCENACGTDACIKCINDCTKKHGGYITPINDQIIQETLKPFDYQ